MSDPVRGCVYIVDDDASVGDSLQWLFDGAAIPSRHFRSPREFLRQVEGLGCGCIILDVRMPEMDGLSLQQALNERAVLMPIIVLTGHANVEMAVSAMQAQAFDFMQKPVHGARLLEKVRAALALCEERLARQGLQDAARARLQSLTPRERQVLERVVAGHANKAIAIDLGVVQRTVEVHRHNVMEKMAVTNLAELIHAYQLALDEG